MNGSLDGVFKVAGMITGVALVTTIVAHPESAKVFRAIGDSFTGALRAAMGK